ncbi:hypothetical protein AAG747_00825 [Rapidithrix thailandica]|uniref:Uncharacterized protein n=1 Tax=Rapidithrix thailandica TaxID=413964 RepID=A0AAW9RY04_9BACT
MKFLLTLFFVTSSFLICTAQEDNSVGKHINAVRNKVMKEGREILKEGSEDRLSFFRTSTTNKFTEVEYYFDQYTGVCLGYTVIYYNLEQINKVVKLMNKDMVNVDDTSWKDYKMKLNFDLVYETDHFAVNVEPFE